MKKVIPHEITLMAFTRNDDGTLSVLDIVETSRHWASHFARRWLRDPQVATFAAAAPGTPWPKFQPPPIASGVPFDGRKS